MLIAFDAPTEPMTDSSSDLPANLPPTESSADTAPPEEERPSAGDAAGQPGVRGPARLRIGSQRAGSPKIKAKPQFVHPEPDLARKVPVPSRRATSTDVEQEVEAALGGIRLEQMLEPSGKGTAVGAPLELDSRHRGRIVSIRGDDVFVDLGGRNQGVLSLRQCAAPPEIGTELEVIVARFDAGEGLYQLTLPGSAMVVEDWSQLDEGMVVEARVTAHNKGGLEIEVNGIRGFIPAGQIAPYRVDDFSHFVGEKFPAVVIEANAERRNLVVSRRAVLEREAAEARQRMLETLHEGDICEGTVRSLQDFGAFVDLGNGVDGLLHVSQLGWHRVRHPSEVLAVGQKVRVKVRKIDPDTRKIGLSLRDLLEDPWSSAGDKYAVGTIVQGRVSRLADFGAFVELEPGVEGLVHISELAHGRVWRAGDVVQEGQQVEAKVLSVDLEQRRIGLSMKAIQVRPEPARKAEPEAADEADQPAAPLPKPKGPLKGGLGGRSGGGQFGLKW